MSSRMIVWLTALAAAFLVFVTVEVLTMGADFALLKIGAVMLGAVGLLDSGWARSHDGGLAIAAIVLAAPVAIWFAAGVFRRGLCLEERLNHPIGRILHDADTDTARSGT